MSKKVRLLGTFFLISIYIALASTVFSYINNPVMSGNLESDDLFLISKLTGKVTEDYKDTVGGYIDKTGKIVIEPSFENCWEFSEGLAAVEVNGKWGFIDRTGKIVINPIYDDVHGFSDGLAAVETNSKWGYIFNNGKVAIKSTYDRACSFSEGLAQTWIGRKARFINKAGEVVIECPYNSNGYFDYEGWISGKSGFKEGVARIDNFDPTNGWRIGYIDKTGKIIAEPKYAVASNFSEGIAVVKKNLDGKSMFINKTGNLAIKQVYDYASTFHEGLASVAINNKWGYIDKSGKVIIEPKFEAAGNFSEGMAYAEDSNGNYGYIDKNGKWIIKPQYYHVHDFEKGLAHVIIKTKNNYYYAYISKDNKIVWKRKLSIDESDVLEEEGP